MNQINRRFLLNERPHGAPDANTFRLERASIPAINEGEILLQTIYLSLDPYMRGRISAAKSYAEPVALNAVMDGGCVARVVASKNPAYAVGDWVLSYHGWQDFAVSNGAGLTALGANPPHPSHALGVLGMTGFTAYMGLLDIGKPQAGETVVVAAATGAVGAMVGQIAKLHGCRVVGIAGGADKCAYAMDVLGFDACVDHKDAALNELLAAACPQGIDVYYENVGGAVFDAVLPLLNTNARVPLCGLVSAYNATELPAGPDRMGLLMHTMLTQRITMKGFIIFDDYAHRYPEFFSAMSAWLADGKIIAKEDVVDGLEAAPAALTGLLEGKNFGKLIVRVASDDGLPL